MSAPLIGRRDALAEAMQAAREAMQPCGEYRPSFRCEWWLCDLCGYETERKAYRGEADMWEHVATHIPVIDAEALVMRVFSAVVHATQGDPTGHLPDCGYTDDNQTCGCAEWGERLHAAIAAALTERAD